MSTPPTVPPTFQVPRASARPWYKKKRTWAAGIFLVLVIAAVGGSETPSQDAPQEKAAAKENTPTPAAEKAPAEKETRAEPDEPEEPEMTSGQENALRSAESYLEISGMSKAGLISQLSSSAGEGYSKAEATFAANNVDVDWNEEAVQSAQAYLDISPMSRTGLIEQLSSPAGDKFTKAQARYAVNKVY